MNPFYPFTPPLLQAFVQKGKRYFVRQEYKRGMSPFEPGVKMAFLISPYKEFATAQDHVGAISHDPHRHLYDWEKEEDRERLKKAAAGFSEYRLFSPVFRTDWENGITDRFRMAVRRYIHQLGWSPGGSEVVHTSYEVRFGDIFLCLKYRRREVKVKLEEVEKI